MCIRDRAVALQRLGEELGGLDFLVGQLRVRVDVAPPANHTLLVLCEPAIYRSGDSSVFHVRSPYWSVSDILFRCNECTPTTPKVDKAVRSTLLYCCL